MSAKQYSASDFKFVEKIEPDRKRPNGHVSLARLKDDKGIEKMVVVKSLRKCLAEKVVTSFSDGGIKDSIRYTDEADNLRKLGDSHPWLTQFYGYAQQNANDGRVAALLAWECIPSLGPVVQVLEAAKSLKKTISFAIKCDWMRRLLKAIQYLHDHGAWQGIFKSANVFIDNDFSIKLTDYSMSSWFDLPSLGHPLLGKSDESPLERITDNGGIPITVENLSQDFSKPVFKESLPYMSLERLKGEWITGDAYSYGVICWEITMGAYTDVRNVFNRVLYETDLGSLASTLNELFDYKRLPIDTPVEVREILDTSGVGGMRKDGQRNDIQTLSSLFEQRLTVLVAKLKKNDNDELTALTRLGLKTDHMLKIEKCQQRQRQRHSPVYSTSNGNVTMTTVPPSTVADSTITSIPRNSSVSAAEFQPLVVGHPPNEVRLHEPWQTQNTDKVHRFMGSGEGGINVNIMANQIGNQTFIKNSTVIIPINGGNVSSPSLPLNEPTPPPEGTLTNSEDELDREDKNLLRKNVLPIEKLERLAKNLDLTDGQFSDLKGRYQQTGLAELCCRLLEFWQEKEAENATKRRLALGLWMADERQLAIEIK